MSLLKVVNEQMNQKEAQSLRDEIMKEGIEYDPNIKQVVTKTTRRPVPDELANGKGEDAIYGARSGHIGS